MGSHRRSTQSGRKAVVLMGVRARVLAIRIMLRAEKHPEAAEALGVKASLRAAPREPVKRYPRFPGAPQSCEARSVSRDGSGGVSEKK